MKYLSRVLLVSLFLASSVGTVLAANNNAASGSRVPVSSDLKKGKGAEFTYLAVAKDLVKKTMKGKLSKNEAKVIEKFIKGKKQNARDVKYLESALKKHSCFVPLNRKSKNLTMFPSTKTKPNWFAIDCKKSSSGKKGGVGSANRTSSSGGGNSTGAGSAGGSAN